MGVESEIERLMERYDSDEGILVSDAYRDGGIDPLFPRLERAAINQVCNGDAELSRYAIWANTVRDNLRSALESLEAADHDEARRLIRRAVNALSAFSEIQALFDPLRPKDAPEQDK